MDDPARATPVEANVVLAVSNPSTKENAMKTVASLRFLVYAGLLAVVGLGVAPTSAQAVVITDGTLGAGSATNPLGLRPGCHYQVHAVRLTAGVTYTIDMTSNVLDSYLILSGFGVQIQDDDSGGNLNARIIFTPTQTGVYNIYTTTFGAGDRGSYRLSVLP